MIQFKAKTPNYLVFEHKSRQHRQKVVTKLASVQNRTVIKWKVQVSFLKRLVKHWATFPIQTQLDN